MSFYFLEYDNNTETAVDKITKKTEAYYSYFNQKIFQSETLPRLNAVYGLGIKSPEKTAFRVLFITTNPTRCNNLFAKSLLIPTNALFNFTTIDQFEADPFGDIWLRKKELIPYYNDYLALKNGIYKHVETGKISLNKPRGKDKKHYEQKQPPAKKDVVRRFLNEKVDEMDKLAIP